MAFLKITKRIWTGVSTMHPGEIIDDAGQEALCKRYVKTKKAEYIDYKPIGPVRNRFNEDQITTRPDAELLTTIRGTYSTIPVPEQGAFNPGIEHFKDGYILAYRSDQLTTKLCKMSKEGVITDYWKFPIERASDLRLIWWQGKLQAVYSRIPPRQAEMAEHICITEVMDESGSFYCGATHRISPEECGRCKNWMPFVFKDRLFFVASVCPHIVYEWTGSESKQLCCIDWQHNWFYQTFLRGNAQCVLIGDRFLGTFHSVIRSGRTNVYDNGFYTFDPETFEPLECSWRTYLPGEAANDPPFKQSKRLKVCFVTGMVKEQNEMLITYGEQDLVPKMLRCSLQDIQEDLKERKDMPEELKTARKEKPEQVRTAKVKRKKKTRKANQ